MLSTNHNSNPPLPNDRGKDGYSFAAEPKAVERKKNATNGATAENAPVNIMYDRRIHRGNTYAAPALPLNAVDPIELQKKQELKRKLRAKKKAEARQRIITPEPVTGRKHMDIQTDLYLEELSDKVPEAFAMTQTDNFINRAPSPLFIPKKSGTDVSTQILEGELFDFEFEVQPILEVLVAKTLEQSLMEIHEEHELEVLRDHRKKFEDLRNAELAEVQRLEDAERRRTEEKERRIKEQKQIQQEKMEIAEKIAARAFAKSYLQNLVPTVFENLANNGYFYDKSISELEGQFLPWLTNEVEKNLKKQELASRLADDLIRSAISKYRNIK